MKKNGFKRVISTMALFGLALILVLAGCEESGKGGGGNNNKKKDPVITSVELTAPTHPVVFAGADSELIYGIKVDGTDITSVDMAGSDVIVGTLSGGVVTAMQGLSLQGTVEVGKEAQTVTVKVSNTVEIGDYEIAVQVKGKASNAVVLKVAEPSPITSVVIVPADPPGEVTAGLVGHLHYTITVQGKEGVSFPIDLKDEESVLFTMADGKPLPEGDIHISLEDAGEITDFNDPADFSFRISVPEGKAGTFSVIAIVLNFPSDPFDLIVQPSVLYGEVTISQEGNKLTADIDNLEIDHDDESLVVSYRWKRSADNEEFTNIDDATGAVYTITSADYDNYVTVEVSCTGYAGVVTATAAVYVRDPTAPSLPGSVSITGEAIIGGKLRAVLSNFPEGAEPIFEWHRVTGDSSSRVHSGTGDDYAEYEVAENDAGHTIQVFVSAHGFGTSINSTPTTMVPYPTVAEQFASLRARDHIPGTHTITVYEDETLAPQSLSFGESIINLTITSPAGAAKTLTTAASSAALFTIPTGQSNVTLTLENVVLQGLSDNNHPLINNISGILVMNDGAVITGNTRSSDKGGGVVNRGTFNMHGGSITGNRGSYGGGVANYGAFNMYGGLITLNTATSSDGEGGAVLVSSAAGKFYMYGGEISHNTAQYGGAVSVDTYGVFAMIGGAISANNANYFGSGALEINTNSTFLMEGGIIHGSNFENTSLKNNGGTGCAVLNIAGGSAFLVKFDSTHSSYETKMELIETELTLEAQNGVLLRPIAATGMVVTGIPQQYIGKTGHLTARTGNSWNEIADPVTVTASTAFVFKKLEVPTGRDFRLEFKEGSALFGRFEKTIQLAIGNNTIALNALNDETPPNVTSISFRGLPWTGTIALENAGLTELGRGSPSSGSITYNVNLTPDRYTLTLRQISSQATIFRFDCILGLGENVIVYDELIRISITDLPKSGIMRLYNNDTTPRAIVCNRFTVGDTALRFEYAVDTNIIQPGHYNLSLEIINTTTEVTIEEVAVFPCELKIGTNNMSYKNLFPVNSLAITGLPSDVTGNLELWNKDTNVKIATAAVSGSSVTFIPSGMVSGEYNLSLHRENVTTPIVEFALILTGGANTTTYEIIIEPPPAKPSILLVGGEWADGNIPSGGTQREQWFRFKATNTSEYVIEFIWGGLKDIYPQMYDGTATTPIGAKPNLYLGYTTMNRNVTAGETYYIKVEPYGTSDNGTYQIRYYDPFAGAATAVQLTADTWASNTMPMDGEHWYKFTANTERQYINVILGTLTYMNVQVYSDTFTAMSTSVGLGGVNAVPGSKDEMNRTLTVGNNYFIRVKPYSADYIGTYQIMFNDPFAAIPSTAVLLTSDTWGGNTMPADGEQWYKFTATEATQYLHFTYDTLDMNIQLYNANFTTSGADTRLNGMKTISRSLTVGNLYYVMVSNNSSTVSGTYQIKFNAKPFETPIPLTGAWTDGNITALGGALYYSFTATSATHFIHVDFGTLTDLYLQLFNSEMGIVQVSRSGESLSNRVNLYPHASYNYTYATTNLLTPGNIYYVKINPHNESLGSGSFRILLNQYGIPTLPTDEIALTEDGWEDGEIPASGNREQWFSFTATAATQYVNVEFDSLTSLNIQLYDSSYNTVGSQASLSGTTTNVSRTLTVSSIYYVKVTPNSSDSGTYKIMFSKTPNVTLPTATTLTEDQFASATMPTNGEHWYSFTATATVQTIYIACGTFDDMYVQLYDSALNTVGSRENMYTSKPAIERTVVAGNIYLIKVTPYSAAKSGTYQIKFFWPFASTVATAVTLTEKVWTDGAVLTADAINWFKFTATADPQHLYFIPGTGADLQVYVYNSEFALVGSNPSNPYGTSNLNITRPVTVGGTYYIKVIPYNSSASYVGSYKIAFGPTLADRPAAP